jgi:hypothetical protein
VKIKKFHVGLFILIILSIVLFSSYLDSSIEVAAECDSYSVDMCPIDCVVCPPCEVCSSISCQTEDFCENIGFNRTWYENIKKRMKAKL